MLCAVDLKPELEELLMELLDMESPEAAAKRLQTLLKKGKISEEDMMQVLAAMEEVLMGGAMDDDEDEGDEGEGEGDEDGERRWWSSFVCHCVYACVCVLQTAPTIRRTTKWCVVVARAPSLTPVSLSCACVCVCCVCGADASGPGGTHCHMGLV